MFIRLDDMDQSKAGTPIIYSFKNRFSFMYRKTHLANIRHLNPSLVIFNFDKVFANDQEFLDEYQRLVTEASIQSTTSGKNLEIWITGIPPYWFTDELAGLWIQQLWEKGRVVFMA